MDNRKIGYILTTGLVALAMGGSALGYLTGGMDEALAHLGYPKHFVVLLGTWKGLAALALAAPAFPRLKEWAYAGLAFTFSGAIVAHLSAGDGIGST
ncbi:MAG: DoxX family protein, partial [Myxococcales bacterium]|nr:DoxX family protein [Myxococcales bacterium]